MNNLKKEGAYIGIILLLLLISLKIVFYRESFSVLIRSAASLLWIFVLPGFTIMYYWDDKIDFLERLIIGVAVSAGITGISSYYLGLFGLNLKYQGIIIPVTLILTGIFLILRKKSLSKPSDEIGSDNEEDKGD